MYFTGHFRHLCVVDVATFLNLIIEPLKPISQAVPHTFLVFQKSFSSNYGSLQSHDHLGSVLGDTTKVCEDGCWDSQDKSNLPWLLKAKAKTMAFCL